MAERDAVSPPDRILSAAAEHVRRNGARRTTVVAVAEDAGMTHANVYRYFPSKAALLEAVTATWLKEVDAALAATADAPDPADDKVERMVLEIARRYREKLDRDPKLFNVFVEADEAGQPVARKHRARLRGLFERVVEEGATAGLMAKDRARAVNMIFDATFRFTHPAAVQFDRDAARAEHRLRLERVIRALLVALRARVPQ